MNLKVEITATNNLHLVSKVQELEEQFFMEINTFEAKAGALCLAQTEHDPIVLHNKNLRK